MSSNEVYILRALLAAYVDDEDRYLKGVGEPYGSIPTEVGNAARAARNRHLTGAPVLNDIDH
jgi:hypothetical protein